MQTKSMQNVLSFFQSQTFLFIIFLLKLNLKNHRTELYEVYAVSASGVLAKKRRLERSLHEKQSVGKCKQINF